MQMFGTSQKIIQINQKYTIHVNLKRHMFVIGSDFVGVFQMCSYKSTQKSFIQK